MITLRLPDDTTNADAWRYQGNHYCPFCLIDAIVLIDIPIVGSDAAGGDDIVLSLATGTAEAIAVTPGTACRGCGGALPLDRATLIDRATTWADKFAPGPPPTAPPSSLTPRDLAPLAAPGPGPPTSARPIDSFWRPSRVVPSPGRARRAVGLPPGHGQAPLRGAKPALRAG